MKLLNRRRDPGRKAFTLLELLAVIFIIAIVAAILFPTINRAHDGSNRVKCGSNIRQIGQALMLYANENKGNYPRTFYKADAPLVFSSDATNSASPRDPFGDKGLPGRLRRTTSPPRFFC